MWKESFLLREVLFIWAEGQSKECAYFEENVMNMKKNLCHMLCQGINLIKTLLLPLHLVFFLYLSNFCHGKNHKKLFWSGLYETSLDLPEACLEQRHTLKFSKIF